MISATLYIAPFAEKKQIQINDIDYDDEVWFIENGVKLSLEELATGEIAMYADIGYVVNGDHEEALELSRGRSCAETLAALRKQCEHMLTSAPKSEE